MKKKFLVLAALVLAFSSLAIAEPVRIGTTYSPRQSEYLGLDWRETYIAILDFGFDIVRLGTYWNEIEKEEGVFDFRIIDWQIEEARKRNIPVVLTVGMKAPRWPEYFIPDWVMKRIRPRFGAEISDREFLREKTLTFIRTVVNHYKDESIIQYWQVENEPLDRAGAWFWWIGEDFLKEEVDLVRELDGKKRPIVINVATYPNKILRAISRFFWPRDTVHEALMLCDVIGFNIYPAVGHQWRWKKFYFWSHPDERREYFSRILDRVRKSGKKAWIVELQAEPWEPGELVHTGKERPPTGWPEMSQKSFEELRTLGFDDTILLWGAEYWLFRKTKHADENWWEMAMTLFKEKKDEAAKALAKARPEEMTEQK